jgi:hypothetical protein
MLHDSATTGSKRDQPTFDKWCSEKSVEDILCTLEAGGTSSLHLLKHKGVVFSLRGFP